MRLTFSICLFCVLQSFAIGSFSQNLRLSINQKNISIENVLQLIEDQTDYYFMYSTLTVDVKRVVDLEVTNKLVPDILDDIFKNTNVSYKINGRLIALSKDGDTSMVTQQVRVSGRVTDSSGQPLPGVSVVVKGTTIGTITDTDGNYSLPNISGDATLVFSFVGMKSQEILVSGKTTVNVKMEEETLGIEEVVAVGYGKQKKINLTGSVETIGGEELTAKPVISTSMALQGVASGVTVTQSSGKPGGDGGTIRIRGIGTLGDSNPLVLVDGIESNLDEIDSNDIESISVLKDAASSAIYGSRAANGVILITTKRGKFGNIKFKYRGYTGWQEFTGLPEFVSGYDYMLKDNEALINAGKTPIWSDDYIQRYKTNSGLYSFEYPDVDYQKLIYTGSGLQQHHNINISGGGEKLNSMASLSFVDQKGLIPNYDCKKYSVRMNNDYKVSEKIHFKLDLFGHMSKSLEPVYGESVIILWAHRHPALLGVYLPDGRYSTNYMNYTNVKATLMEGGSTNTDNYAITGKFVANVQPIDDLDIEFAYAPDFGYSFYKNIVKPVGLYTPDSDEPAMYDPIKSGLTQKFSRYLKNNLHGLINYSKTVNLHSVSILLGYEQIDYHNNGFDAYRENFAFLDYMEMSTGSVVNMNNGGSASEWALRSYFGRVNYKFNEKYLLEANFRYDGSSRFATGYKYGSFPSLAAGWRISEESFMANNNWVDNLKLRASWGKLGNQNIGNYPFASVVKLGLDYVFNDVPVSGAALNDMANEEISWETNTTTNIGLDFGLFKKLSGSFEYYVRHTNDILLRLPVPMTIGLNAPYQNAGKVKNTGWDFNLKYNNYDKEIKYSIGLTLSDVKNEVVDLKGSGPYIGDYTITREGDPIGALYMLQSDGLFQSQEEINNHATQFGTIAPGDIKYVDQLTVDTDGNGIADSSDGKIDVKDRVLVGSNIPRYSFGLDLNAIYKGFDMMVFLQGVGKRDSYLSGYNSWAFNNFNNIQKYQMDSWTPNNTDASQPRVIDASSHNNFNHSDFWKYNGAYVRIKTFQFGYTIPARTIKSVGVDKLRLYFAANNLFTISGLPKGWDAEQPIGDTRFYPITSSYVFGIDLNF